MAVKDLQKAAAKMLARLERRVPRRAFARLLDPSGQSVVEFLLMLPAMVGFAILLIRMNTVIQMSIVNQQYARHHAIWLAFNSPIYPESRFRMANFDRDGWNRMLVGVSENNATNESGEYNPEPSMGLVARTKQKAGGEGPAQTEPEKRGLVHLRTTVSLCTQSNVIKSGNAFSPLASTPLRDPISSKVFMYCRSPIDE